MLRKALTLGMVFILALSLLAVSMITCFTYDAQAHVMDDGHGHFRCVRIDPYAVETGLHAPKGDPWCCYWYTQ